MSTTDTTTATVNPACPDYQSHGQNAEDVWVDQNRRQPSTSDDFAAIDAIAEAEYRCCEGH